MDDFKLSLRNVFLCVCVVKDPVMILPVCFHSLALASTPQSQNVEEKQNKRNNNKKKLGVMKLTVCQSRLFGEERAVVRARR